MMRFSFLDHQLLGLSHFPILRCFLDPKSYNMLLREHLDDDLLRSYLLFIETYEGNFN